MISIDLGGTNIKITVLSNDGEIETLWSITTDTSEKGSQIISDIISSIKNKLTERNIPDSDLLGIGMGSCSSYFPCKSWGL
ncbi:ROK family protein [Streptococcus pneumoniae]|nr:ROK family protein [Streptococcus pneumoniae]